MKNLLKRVMFVSSLFLLTIFASCSNGSDSTDFGEKVGEETKNERKIDSVLAGRWYGAEYRFQGVVYQYFYIHFSENGTDVSTYTEDTDKRGTYEKESGYYEIEGDEGQLYLDGVTADDLRYYHMEVTKSTPYDPWFQFEVSAFGDVCFGQYDATFDPSFLEQ